MIRNLICVFLFTLLFTKAKAQDELSFLKANAVHIHDPQKLSDSIYNYLLPFRVIMVGEMHGTNESAPFIKGLADLFTGKGDSVQIGLEITPGLMAKFFESRSDSGVYKSEFFENPPYLDGRESVAWAELICGLFKNPKASIFFFDISREENVLNYRDSLMAMNIKSQYEKHPMWKLITLSGNFHNRISDPLNMISYFKRNVRAKTCSLNMEYKEGTCYANFSGKFEIKRLGSYPSVYNSTEGYDSYFLLYESPSNNDYDGIYFTKNITAAEIISLKK